MNLTLKIWRQLDASDKGKMVDYKVTEISEHMSFLEMMDMLMAKKRYSHRREWLEEKGNLAEV